jgi:uncharacterized protein (UPF0332 family)
MDDELLVLAEECIKEAKVLFKNELFKGALNRCYYGYFDAVKYLLEKDDEYSKTHIGIQNKFYNNFIKTEKIPRIYHKYLIDLFEKRAKVDYDGFGEYTEEEVKESIEKTEEFINLIRKHFI